MVQKEGNIRPISSSRGDSERTQKFLEKCFERQRAHPPVSVSQSFKFSSDMHNSVGHPYCCHPVSNLSSFLGQSYLGCMRRGFSQEYNWWESVFLSRLEHTPVICAHFQSRGWICPVGKSSKPISVQMQIILTNYSINTPQIAILCEVNGSYLSNKEAEKHKLDHARGAD